jgi:hypothetical protein
MFSPKQTTVTSPLKVCWWYLKVALTLLCAYTENYKPREDCREQPGQQADDKRSSLRTNVTRLQGLADRVVTFEADGQNGQHGGMSNCQLHERHHFTCNVKTVKVNVKLSLYKPREVSRTPGNWGSLFSHSLGTWWRQIQRVTSWKYCPIDSCSFFRRVNKITKSNYELRHVILSVCMRHFVCNWIDFDEIWYLYF